MKKITFIFVAVLLLALPIQAFAAEDGVPDLESSMDVEGNTWGLGLDAADLQERYDSVMEELKGYGFGEQYELQRPEFEGYSLNTMQIFKDSYGDMWNELKLESPNLPSDFSASIFLEQGIAARSELFSDVQSSSLYKTVMGQISVESVWGQAEKGLPSPESLFANSYKTDFKSQAQNEKDENQNYLAGIQEGTLDLFTQSGKKLSESNKTSFWNAVQEMRDIISSGEGSPEDIFDQMK